MLDDAILLLRYIFFSYSSLAAAALAAAIAVARWKKHPPVSAAILAAATTLGLAFFANTISSPEVSQAIVRLADLVAWALLLGAAVGWRQIPRRSKNEPI